MNAITEPMLLFGFGATNRAVAAALVARGHRVLLADDAPGDDARSAARALDLEVVEAPDSGTLRALVEAVDVVVPAPGLPDRHPVFALADAAGVPVRTEFDLAARWDRRPIVAITGTDGKTTVTTMVTAMLRAGGIACVDAGNNDLPLVAAIDDPAPQWFVVEASSFRLGRTQGWTPRVATWLNLAPDHLDVHATHEDYEAAKARIWASQGPGDVAIGNLDDRVVARHLVQAPGHAVGFSIERDDAAYRREGTALVGPRGAIVAVADLPRALPHDLSNALAAAASASAAGVHDDVIADTLRTFELLPHRVSLVATIDGVDYYDDSKATVPHATLAAVRGFESVVLIAGGRNKGLDLAPLAEAAPNLRAVVAIGEAAGEIADAFAPTSTDDSSSPPPVERASSMAAAVSTARRHARPGDTVLLSPACASFDWYRDYAARGDDFVACVTALQEQP